MHNKSTRRTAIKRVGAGGALVLSAALLTGCDLPAPRPRPHPRQGPNRPGGALAHGRDLGLRHARLRGSHNGSLHSVKLGQSGFLGTAYGFTGSS